MEETNGDLELVKGEFGQRLHDLERKLQNALREKDSMKKQMTVMQQELMNRLAVCCSCGINSLVQLGAVIPVPI